MILCKFIYPSLLRAALITCILVSQVRPSSALQDGQSGPDIFAAFRAGTPGGPGGFIFSVVDNGGDRSDMVYLNFDPPLDSDTLAEVLQPKFESKGWSAPRYDPSTKSVIIKRISGDEDLYLAVEGLGYEPIKRRIGVFVSSRGIITFARNNLTIQRIFMVDMNNIYALLIFPPRMAPGDRVLATLTQQEFTPSTGTWFISLDDTGDRIPGIPQDDDATLTFDLPQHPHLGAETPLSLLFVDNFDATLIKISLNGYVHIPKTRLTFSDDEFWLNSDNFGVAGGLLCLTGRYRDYSSLRFTLAEDGAPLIPVAASSQVIILKLPETRQQAHTIKITGDISSQTNSRSLSVSSLPDREKLIDGTRERVRIEVLEREKVAENVYAIDTNFYVSSGGIRNIIRGSTFALSSVMPPSCRSRQEPFAPTGRALLPATPPIPAQDVEVEIRQGLKETLKRFDSRRKIAEKWITTREGKPYYQSFIVERLIDDTARSLVQATSRREFLPLRDYLVRDLRSMFRALYIQAGFTPSDSGARRASLAHSSSEVKLLEKDKTDSFLRMFYDALKRIVEAEHLTIKICVVSKPEGANFRFFPTQDIDNERGFSTNSTFPGVWIGTYRYELAKKGYSTVSGTFDFVDAESSALECNLVKDGVGPISCKPAGKEGRLQCQKYN